MCVCVMGVCVTFIPFHLPQAPPPWYPPRALTTTQNTARGSRSAEAGGEAEAETKAAAADAGGQSEGDRETAEVAEAE